METSEKEFLFVIGVAKAGTTSLFHYLSSHPAIQPCCVKQPGYFLPKECFFDPPIRVGEAPLSEYMNLFQPADATLVTRDQNRKIYLDASPQYFTFPKSADYISKTFSKAKIILLLREPIDRLQSCYKMTKSQGRLEHDVDFDEYVRRMFEWRPGDHMSYKLLLEEGRYSNFLSQWMSIFPQDSIKVYWFNDIASSPKAVLKDICKFISIEGDLYDNYDFLPKNTSVIRRADFIRNALLYLKKNLELLLPQDSVLHRQYLLLISRISSFIAPVFLKPHPEISMSQDTRLKLHNYYKDDAQLLENLVGNRPPWANS